MEKNKTLWLVLLLAICMSFAFVGCGDSNDIDGDVDGDDEAEIDGDDEAEIDGDDEAEIDGDDEAEIDGDDEAEIDGDDEAEIDGDNEAEVDGDDEGAITQSASFSKCGGFDQPANTKVPNPNCGNEELVWTFDSSTGSLNLINQDIFLNCCGIHTLDVSDLAGGGFLVAEEDAPEQGGGRCNCMCLFDFMVDIEDVTEQVLPIKITRLVTDSSSPAETVWEGSLDLSLGTGTVTIKENVGWCD